MERELTKREKEVLELIAQGIIHQMIAERLFISKNTVKAHVFNILRKLYALNSPHAVAIAKDEGII